MVDLYKDSMKASFELALEEARTKSSVEAALAVMARWAGTELVDKRRKVTDEMAAEAVRLKREGWTDHAIAERLGVTGPTVRRTVRRVNALRR